MNLSVKMVLVMVVSVVSVIVILALNGARVSLEGGGAAPGGHEGQGAYAGKFSKRDPARPDGSGLDVAEEKLRRLLKDVELTSNPNFALDQQVKAIVSELGADGALEFFKTLPVGRQRRVGIAAALYEMSRVNREAAVSLAKGLAPSDRTELTIPNLFLPKDAEDFDRSLALAITMSGEERDGAFRVLVQSGEYIASENFRSMLDSDGLTAHERDVLNISYGRALIREDVRAAAAALAEMPARYKNMIAVDLLGAWPPDEVEKGVKWMYDNRIDPNQVAVMLPVMVDRLFESDRARALKVVESLPPGRASDKMYPYMVERLFAEDAAAARQWVEGLRPGLSKGMAIEAYSGQLMKDSPIEAIESLRSFVMQGEVSEGAEARLIDEWARNDPQAALFWVEKHQNVVGHESMGEVVLAGWASSAPYELLEEIENGTVSHVSPRISGVIINSLAGKGQYAEAADLIVKHGWMEAASSGTFLARWLHEDSIGASSWVAGLPKGETYDSGARQIAISIAGNDRESAIEWVNSIASREVKEDAYRQIDKISK